MVSCGEGRLTHVNHEVARVKLFLALLFVAIIAGFAYWRFIRDDGQITVDSLTFNGGLVVEHVRQHVHSKKIDFDIVCEQECHMMSPGEKHKFQTFGNTMILYSTLDGKPFYWVVEYEKAR